MAEATNIEWCDSTFNPWIGCTQVSPACDDCYAARSTPARTLGVAWGSGEPRHRTGASNWALPERWQREAAAFQAQHGRRRRVFCASLADVFDNEVPSEWREDLFALIRATPDVDWLLVTKRIGNAAPMIKAALSNMDIGYSVPFAAWPWPNVWLGITVVDQAEANRDVPKLLCVPAAVHFLSVEPMLGRIYVEDIPDPAGGVCLKPLAGLRWVGNGQGRSEAYAAGGRIDWVICGGESGPKARPMHPDWARSLRDQCASAGVPFLFKQWGEWVADPDLAHRDVTDWSAQACTVRIGKKTAGRLLDGRTHDEFPAA